MAAGPYFRGVPGWPGAGNFGSSHEAAAFSAVMELAGLLAGREGAENWPLSQLLAGRAGIVDPDTHHTVLPVIIARVEGGVFRPLKRSEAVAGDPYLTRSRSAPASVLRVVS